MESEQGGLTCFWHQQPWFSSNCLFSGWWNPCFHDMLGRYLIALSCLTSFFITQHTARKETRPFGPLLCKKGSVLHRISYSYVRGLCVSQTYPYLQFDEHNFKFWSYCSWIIYDAQACFQREIVLFLICFLWGTQTDMYQPAVGLFPLSFRWSDQLAKTRVTRTLFGSWQMFALETKSDLSKTFRRPRRASLNNLTIGSRKLLQSLFLYN